LKAVTSVEDHDGRRAIRSKGSTAPDLDVVVIGAGPYGLSAAAYLKASGLAVRLFGEPMDFWANKMPEGMLLRSPRAASSIADPAAAFTLEAYEQASGTKPSAPVSLETFVQYGRCFGIKWVLPWIQLESNR
jgi:FAD-dependent urate hydroxylase